VSTPFGEQNNTLVNTACHLLNEAITETISSVGLLSKNTYSYSPSMIKGMIAMQPYGFAAI
jgi:predicted anti-sigma-YlaC factor YlaD